MSEGKKKCQAHRRGKAVAKLVDSAERLVLAAEEVKRARRELLKICATGRGGKDAK